MALLDRTSIRRHGMAAIVAAVFAALAAASAGPAWGQDTGDPARDAMAPARMMQMMMDAPSDDGDAAALTGHGFLLDKGVFTTIDHPDAVAKPSPRSMTRALCPTPEPSTSMIAARS